MTVLNVTRRPVTVIVQGRGLTGDKGYKGDPGTPAPNTVFQYSVDGTTWTTTATDAQWYRQSGDNGTTWSEAIAISTTAYADGKITQTITEDVEDKAPSEAAVFDALALKAPLASPTFTGDVVVPDQTAGNNSTKAANTKYVDAGLGLKANITDVDDALALKADTADLADALDLKADADAVINALESSVNENIPIFDGVTGDKLKDSGVKLSDKADVDDVADAFDTRCKTTPEAGKIPVADGNGDIDSGWLKDASTTVKGVVELATSAEAAAGNDTTRAITPSVSGSRITFATTSTNDATSPTAAPLKTAGGLAVAKSAWFGGPLIMVGKGITASRWIGEIPWTAPATVTILSRSVTNGTRPAVLTIYSAQGVPSTDCGVAKYIIYPTASHVVAAKWGDSGGDGGYDSVVLSWNGNNLNATRANNSVGCGLELETLNASNPWVSPSAEYFSV